MRRVVLSCLCLSVLFLPAAASARVRSAGQLKPGYVVVQKALNDGGPNGRPAVTLVVRPGFVLGRITQEARVDIYRLPNSPAPPPPRGQDVRSRSLRWHGLPGVEYIGSGFRFSAVGGSYHVVIRGSGIYVFAGGVRGSVKLRGSTSNPTTDGTYSIDAARPRSLPTRQVERRFGTQ